MIVCSCNVISDREIRNAAFAAHAPAGMTEVYRRLGRTPGCGRCKHSIKDLVLTTHQQHDRRTEQVSAYNNQPCQISRVTQGE